MKQRHSKPASKSFAALARQSVQLTEKEMKTIRQMMDPNDPIGKRRRLTPKRDSVIKIAG